MIGVLFLGLVGAFMGLIAVCGGGIVVSVSLSLVLASAFLCFISTRVF